MGKCDNDTCGAPHNYKEAPLKIGLMVYWFCSPQCKQQFRCEQVDESSQREFMRTGGWQ